MQCDVRECPKDEIVPLFNSMTGSKPEDVKWDGNHCFVRFTKGKARISYWIRRGGHTSFEFYPGVDNIRFDGWLEDEECLNKLNLMTNYGKGTKVSDFFKLTPSKKQPSMTLGVGDGTGELFVQGDYDSIKACQQKLLDLEKYRQLFFAAIEYIEKSPCDPDITSEQAEAWLRLQTLLAKRNEKG